MTPNALLLIRVRHVNTPHWVLLFMKLRPRKNSLLCRTRPVTPVDPVEDAIVEAQIERLRAEQQRRVGSSLHRAQAFKLLTESVGDSWIDQVISLETMRVDKV
jgi:hypothetical protein